MQTRLLIVEDKEAEAELIQSIVKTHFPKIKVIGKTGNVFNAIKLIQAQKPDIVLLDVLLENNLKAFDLLDAFSEIDFKIVFITGERDVAIKAFEYSAMHFILKPIDEAKLILAINKCKDAIYIQEQFKVMRNYIRHGEVKNIIVPVEDGQMSLNPNNIIYYKVDGNINRMKYRGNERSINICLSGKRTDEMLAAFSNIVRVHQSCAININYIKHYDNKNKIIEMHDGENIEISRNGETYLKQRLQESGKDLNNYKRAENQNNVF